MVSKMPQAQIGKSGVTENFISTLKTYFNSYKIVRISVLKSAKESGSEGRQQIKEYKEKILSGLGNHFAARIIGFVIVVRKVRKGKST